MTTPRRLLESGESLSGDLLQALREAPGDPSPADLQTVATKLGLTLGVPLNPPPELPAATTTATGSASVSTSFSTLTVWALTGVAGGVGVSVAIAVSSRLFEAPAPQARDTPVLVRSVVLPADTAPRSNAVAPDVPAPPPAEAVRSSPARPLPAALEPEESEYSLLQRARADLPGFPARTLALCSLHERSFKSGLLAQERDVLAIEALLSLGLKREAKLRAEVFFERYPRSAHRPRLEGLLNSER